MWTSSPSCFSVTTPTAATTSQAYISMFFHAMFRLPGSNDLHSAFIDEGKTNAVTVVECKARTVRHTAGSAALGFRVLHIRTAQSSAQNIQRIFFRTILDKNNRTRDRIGQGAIVPKVVNKTPVHRKPQYRQIFLQARDKELADCSALYYITTSVILTVRSI